MDWQRKARPGQPLRVSATAYNAFVDAAVAVRRGAFAGDAGSSALPGGYVELVNRTAEKIPAFTPRIVKGVTTTTTPRDRFARPTMETASPYDDSPQRTQVVAVTQQEIAVNGVGRACVSGVSWCRVDQSQSSLLFPGVRLGLRAGDGSASGDAMRIDSLGPAAMLSVPIDTGVADEHGQVWLAVVSLGIRDDSFWARIEGASLVTANAPIWSYQWQEVVIDADANPSSVDPWTAPNATGYELRSSTTWGQALNTLEAGNTGSLAYGIAIAGPDFTIGNTNFSLRPVPSGAIVQMRYSSRWGALSSEGSHHEVLFSAPNPVAGTCTSTSPAYPYYGFEEGEEIDEAYGPIENDLGSQP